MTPAEADGFLFDGTTFVTDELSLAFSRGTPAAGSAERGAALLRLLGQLEEALPESREDREAHAEVARVEAKVDLLLQVVGSLVALQHAPPQREPVVLSCRGLVWRVAPRDLLPEVRGRLTLYPHAAVPLPLEVGVRVLAIDHELSPPRAWLAFEPLPEALSAELERYTFRRHRRAVAGLRAARVPAEGGAWSAQVDLGRMPVAPTHE